jgi:integrase
LYYSRHNPIKLLLLTGCRRGEIIGLQWGHVDFERHCLRLPDSKTREKVTSQRWSC